MTSGPELSIIVPVYEDWDKVDGLLRCLAAQTLAADEFEIVLVDNESLHVSISDLPANARIEICRTAGAYAARNFGVAIARGSLLAFTDADCLPAPDWLKIMLAKLRDDLTGRMFFAGRIDMSEASARPGAYEIFDLVKGIPQQRYVRRGYGATANLAMPKALFTAVGGFDASRFSGGDLEFCRRAGKQGYKLVYVPEARVGHRLRKTWAAVRDKARRIKGGQIAAGSTASRLIFASRTMMPPVRGVMFFLRANEHPMRHRVIASLVLLRVWGAELMETVRIALGQPPMRR